MRVRFQRSFEKSLAALETKPRAAAVDAVARLLDYFKDGPKPIGLGFRQLRKPYWEVRVSLDRRILFSLEGDLIRFLLVESHDEIQRSLDRL